MTLRTLGTAGHVDHGKTALVQALTGTDTDRLEEERRRGISIELGYALLDLGDGQELSVVDVPGHERFVRTMVAGATGIDLALVCIACDDGVMPQTREHLAILDLLEVSHGVVALTKRDLVDDEGAALARDDAAELLATSGLAAADVVEVSARTGLGLDELRAALRRAARAARTTRASGRTRLPVDRVFSLRGIGTVVTGTLWGGHLAVGDRVTLLPKGVEGRVRSLQTHDRDVAEATDGGRVAACLVGVERTDIDRGTTLVTGPAPRSSYRLDVELHPVEGAPPVRAGDHVEVLHGTAVAHARVVLLDGEGLAQLRLEQPLATLRGDRVVLRALAQPATVAGGVIADPRPARHTGGPQATARLRALLAGSDADVLEAAAGEQPTRTADVVEGGLLDPAPAAAAEEALLAAGRLIALGDGWLMLPADYAAASAAAAARLTERAAAAPLAPGLPLPAVTGEGRHADALAGRLERDGVLERRGAEAVAPGTKTTSETAARAAAVLLEALAADPRLDAALTATGLDVATGRALVAVLESEQRLVRLADGLAVSQAAYEAARRIVIDGCLANGRFTLAELRDATGTSRRYAQALLERMDADGTTRRIDDYRVLRRRATAGT
ncbi:MAG: selenocysteine-specific elongation factor [Gaiellaceae bacterium]|nr:selenocysteine-specific elongation factor [Gaiellaceae bacterium]